MESKNLTGLSKEERSRNEMAIYCFECGVEVSESQKVVRNGRVYCSQAHSTSPRQKPAPPRGKSATQLAPAHNPPTQAPAAHAAQPPAGRKATATPPPAPGTVPRKAYG